MFGGFAIAVGVGVAIGCGAGTAHADTGDRNSSTSAGAHTSTNGNQDRTSTGHALKKPVSSKSTQRRDASDELDSGRDIVTGQSAHRTVRKDGNSDSSSFARRPRNALGNRGFEHPASVVKPATVRQPTRVLAASGPDAADSSGNAASPTTSAAEPGAIRPVEAVAVGAGAPAASPTPLAPARPTPMWTLYTIVGREIDRIADRHVAAREPSSVTHLPTTSAFLTASAVAATPTITSTTTIGNFRDPVIVTSPDGETLYVASNKIFRADKVLVVDASTLQTTATIAVRGNPRAMTLSDDGDTLYVAHWANGDSIAVGEASYVSVIDTVTAKVTSTIKIEQARPSWQWFGLNGGAISMALRPDSSDLYVTSTDSGRLYVVDTAQQAITQTVQVREAKGWFQKDDVYQPEGIALSPDGSELYITEQDEKTVRTVDLNSGTVVKTVTVGDIGSTKDFATVRILAMGSDGNLYITSYRKDAVKVVDPRTGTVVKTIPVGDGPTNAVASPDGSAVYVLNRRDESVSVIDTRTGTVTATLEVGVKPTSVFFDPDGTLAYVAGYDTGWDDNAKLIRIETELTPVPLPEVQTT
jgi:YVTN family beta-propeller protein